MSYAKLRGKIREVFGTQEAFAEAMGMSRSALSMRLNNKIGWSLAEARKACELLLVDDNEVSALFFTQEIR